jgi:spoIIIJ-associated protein
MTNNLNSSQNGKSISIQAKSIEQAIVKAAASLNVTQDEVGYKIVRKEEAKGLFAFFKSTVVEIEAWVKQAKRGNGRDKREKRHGHGAEHKPRSRPERQPRDEQAPQGEPLSAERVEELKSELIDFCAGICSRIAAEPVEVTATVQDDRLILNINNPYIIEQIGKNSKLAEALEHVLRKKPRHLRQELPFRIFVDVNGARKSREEELVQMAQDLSAKVFDSKKPVVLNYKSSYDRKIIHMALDKDDRVYTKSIGSGPNRKLMILPSKGGSSETHDIIED